MLNMNIDIKTEDLVDLELFPTKKLKAKLQSALNRIGRDGKNFWKSEAGRRLKSSRLAYQNSIEWSADIHDRVSIGLTSGTDRENKLANAVETGFAKFDMKPGLLAGRDYRVIPLNVNRNIVFRNPKVFRVVSTKSPSNSWIHPGFDGVDIADTVVDQLNEVIIPKRIGDLLDNL